MKIEYEWIIEFLNETGADEAARRFANYEGEDKEKIFKYFADTPSFRYWVLKKIRPIVKGVYKAINREVQIIERGIKNGKSRD